MGKLNYSWLYRRQKPITAPIFFGAVMGIFRIVLKKTRYVLTAGFLFSVFLELPATAQSDTLPAGENDTLNLRVRTTFSGAFSVVTDFTSDPLGNVYVLYEYEFLDKYDAAGRFRARFSQNRLGNASSVLAGNGLTLFLWYADMRNVLFLDRNMTQLGGALNLIDAGFPEARTIGMSADGNIWLYDEVAFKLKKISTTGEVLRESQRMNTEFDGRISFQQILDDGVQVVGVDSTLGFFVFDAFGQFQRRITVNDTIQQASLENNNLCWIDRQQHLHTLAINIPLSEQQWIFPETVSKADKIKLVPGGVMITSGTTISVLK